ncbi:MAG: adenylate/guanylate cyclase domain-containing protein, partial [Chromatiales bacterium]|nr:adenylate/guanylate cyclase domain-containing protein [Chromatiales bacterium]
GSTQGFQDHGDVTGRGLQQRHFSIVDEVLAEFNGTLFNTAGDGAWSFFDSAEDAVNAAIKSQRLVAVDNRESGSNVRLAIRAGVHYGPTLQDGIELAGHSVNLAARVADLATSAEISISRDTFSELSSVIRGMCGEFSAHSVKGINQPVDVTFVHWRDTHEPVRLYIQEMEAEFPLDREQPNISIGRQRTREGRHGNDIVLRLPSEEATNRISRFQVELHWSDDGLALKCVTDQTVVIDGRELKRNDIAAVTVGSHVILSDVAHLHFLASSRDDSDLIDSGATVFVGR